MQVTPSAHCSLVGIRVPPFGVGFDLGGKRGVERAGQNRIDANPRTTEFARKRLGQLNNPCLRRGVQTLPRFNDLGTERRKGDDRTPAAFAHVVTERAHQTIGSFEVDVEHAIELVIRGVQQALTDVCPWRDHQCVSIGKRLGERVDTARIGDVHGKRFSRTSALCNDLSGGLGGFSVEVRADNVRTGIG